MSTYSDNGSRVIAERAAEYATNHSDGTRERLDYRCDGIDHRLDKLTRAVDSMADEITGLRMAVARVAALVVLALGTIQYLLTQP